MKYLMALFLLTTVSLSQDRVSSWQGTISTTTWMGNKKVLLSIDTPSSNICVYDSSGGPVMVAFSAADTAAASSGYSNFTTIPAGAVFDFPARATTTIFLKAIGTAAQVIITRY